MNMNLRIAKVFIVGLLFTASANNVRAHGETLIQIAALTRRIESATTNTAPLYLQRGELYREHQDWVAAEADYAHAAKLDPQLVAVDLCRAGMLADAGELDAAKTLFDKVIARSPRYGEAFIGRGRVLVKQNVHDAVIPDFQRGLDLLQHPEPEHFLKLAQALMVRQRVNEALGSLDKGIAKFGPIVPLQAYAIDLELQRENTEAALARLETIIELADRQERWLVRQGDIFVAAGRSTEARKSYQAALKAIDLLPGRIKQSSPMMELQARVHAALKRIVPSGSPVESSALVN